MNQYTDLFIEEGGREGRGGGRGRNRGGNGGYIYRGREDDGYQHSPTSRDIKYGLGTAPISISRSTQQVRIPQHPMSSRQGGQSFPVPPVPRAPSNSSNGTRGPPPRPLRQGYLPSNLDPSEVQEVQQNPNFSYRLNEQPVRSQQGYHSQQSGDDKERLSPTNRPSVPSSRSIFIGFDPSNPVDATNSLGVIPNFPPAPPPTSSESNRKPSGVGPPPSARRGTSPYYSQQALMVSPIPEESLASSDRHESYASSAAIPAGWGDIPMESYDRDGSLNDSDEYETRTPTGSDFEEERGLVRQASMGRKSRPVITEIRSSERSKGFDQCGSKSPSSAESFKTGHIVGSPVGVARGFPRFLAERGSSTLNPDLDSGSSLPNIFPRPQNQSPASLSSSNSPAVQLPVASSTDDYMNEKYGFQEKVSRSSSPTSEQESGGSSAPAPSWETTPTSREKSPIVVEGLPVRRIPPRLNLDAVREAEARGSLTSLPDLIKRATKLAAVLETGRPDSRWDLRRGFLERSNGRDTDSISDILASFPPPALAQGRNRGTRTMSQWPLPDDFGQGGNSPIGPSNKQSRRICGLPLWAFILLVILALLVISAAVIVPLQLVNLSKGKGSNSSDSSPVAQCKEKNPCLNGGENIAAKNFCGCVCTNGFTGSNCSQEADSSCTTVDLKDQKGKGVSGIENVTMGNALPRLFKIAEPLYNIELDMAVILAVFSNESISCTAQNALVTFNGVAIPSKASNGKRALADAIAALEKRQNLVVASTASTATPTSTATGAAATASDSDQTRVSELDPDAVDFARVIVLYLTNAESLKVAGQAQTALQTEFTAGRDFGNISLENNITLDFDNRSIILSDGEVVGNVNVNATTAINSTTVSVKEKRFIEEPYLDLLS